MQRSLRQLSVAGLTSNRAFLSSVLSHPAFLAGETDTGFLGTHAQSLLPAKASQELQDVALMAAVFARYLDRHAGRHVLPSMVPGFRNNRWRSERVGYQLDDQEVWVGYQALPGGALSMQVPVPGVGLRAAEISEAPTRRVECIAHSGQDLLLECDGHRRKFRVTQAGDRCVVLVDGEQFDLSELPRFPERQRDIIQGGCTAPMPATVARVLVNNGDRVSLGDSLIVLEAMKMEHLIKADAEGLVGELQVQEGDQVQSGELLVVVAPAAD